MAEIETICAGGNFDIQALRIRAISEGLDVATTRTRALAIVRASRASAGPHIVIPTGPSGADHLTAALMVRAGYSKAAEKEYGEKVMEQSKRLHAASLVDIAIAALRMDGRDAPLNGGELAVGLVDGRHGASLVSGERAHNVGGFGGPVAMPPAAP